MDTENKLLSLLTQQGPLFDLNPFIPTVLDIREFHLWKVVESTVVAKVHTDTTTFNFSSPEQAQHFSDFLTEAKLTYIKSVSSSTDPDYYISTKLTTIQTNLFKQITDEFKSISTRIDLMELQFASAIQQIIASSESTLSTQVEHLQSSIKSKLDDALLSVPRTMSGLNKQLSALEQHVTAARGLRFDSRWSGE